MILVGAFELSVIRMDAERFYTYRQDSKDRSPRSLSCRLMSYLFAYAWFLLCRWTPHPLNGWRLLCLKLFGASISGTPFVHAGARIKEPWNIVLGDRSCLADRAELYSLGRIEIGEGATVAQEAYLCAGTHDFNDPHMALKTAPIVVGAKSFIGARAFILPGVVIGEGAVVGACAVVTADVEPWCVTAGNPSRVIGRRDRH